MVASFSKFCGKTWIGFCFNNGKRFFVRGCIFKPTERAKVLLKNGPRDFQISPPFERSTGFYVTISGNFERFQYFNFEIDFLENKNLCQKTEVLFFS